MKKRWMNRVLALALALTMVLGTLPVGAVDAAGTGRFCLVAEAGGRLVIAPQYVSYNAEDTVKQALVNSGHTFRGIEDGWVNEIDGVYGNYTRSDQTGTADLEGAAEEVTHYRFSENNDSKPSEALQTLMTVMADYLEEAADVQAAAEDAYEEAVERFVGASDEEALALAETLEEAVEQYKANQEVVFTVAFDIAGAVSVRAENAFGKAYASENGMLELPSGTYTFMVSDSSGCHVSGSIAVTRDMVVTASLPGAAEWLKTDTFVVSGGYGDEFGENVFTLGNWSERSVEAYVPDSFTGTVYSYAEHMLETGTAHLTAVYQDRSGTDSESSLAFQSYKSGAEKVMSTGAQGNTVIYRVSQVNENDGYTYSMDYAVTFCRIPSLKSLLVVDPERNAAQAATAAFTAYQTEYTYKVVDTIKQLTVTPVPFKNTYDVYVNDMDAVNGAIVSLNTDETGACTETVISVKVVGNGYTTTYTLTVLPGAGQKITFVTTTADVSVCVTNHNGEELPYTQYKGTDSYNRYQYTLVPGESYNYVANAGYYYTSGQFTMEQSANTTVTVDVPADADWLESLALGNSAAASSKGAYSFETEFTAEEHAYTVVIPDAESSVYLWADFDEALNATAFYDQIASSELYHGVEKQVEITPGQGKGVQLQRLLLSQNPYGNTMTVRLSKRGTDEDGKSGILYYQDYILNFQRELSLKQLTVNCNGRDPLLTREDESHGYDPQVTAYRISVPVSAAELKLTPAVYTRQTVGGSWNTCYGEETTGYYTEVAINGKTVAGDGLYVLPLSQTSETESITVTVYNEKVPGSSTVYTVTVQKDAPIFTSFELQPENALLTVYEQASGNRLWPDETGAYELSEGYSYQYALTLKGYVGKTGTISVIRDVQGNVVLCMGELIIPVVIGEDGQSGTAQVSLTLDLAPVNDTIDPAIPSEWPDFRGDSSNNAVTDVKIPISNEQGTLYWANKLGDGIDSGAVGSPIFVDGDLITYAGDHIFRLDTVTGEILAQGTMAGRSSFAITPPVYADGMIFVALSKGTIQAFDAKTLTSLWVYRDELEGQPNTPVTVKNGYLYTGFWVSEVADANFVCLSVTDEDPNTANEEKIAVWKHTQLGGFYWAGAYVADEFLLVGTDDGTSSCVSKTSMLLLLDPLTGKVLDHVQNLNGDIRSSICYDQTTNAYYFTSKGGTFYSVKVEKTTEGYALTTPWTVALKNGTDKTPMSTSTPVVYNGRAYVGVSGAGQFVQYGGHSITVIDLNKKAIAYRADTQGYPQTSGLLTTAYEKDTGYVYIYFFDNYTPGKLRVLRDKAGQTAVDYVTVEGNYSTPYVLFAPVDEHAQYAICSPITDTFGTVYFKNDSAHLMAFGPAVEKIEVKQNPSKTVYAAGESFDKTGMVVVATYSNGLTRDVTDYVTASEIRAGDTMVTLTFPHVLYHNQDGDGQTSSAGITTVKPTTTVAITVTGEVLGATAIQQIAVSGDQVTVTLNGVAKAGWKLMVAAYDKATGKQLAVSVKAAAVAVQQSVMLSGAAGANVTVKVFLVDENFNPVMQAQTYTK